MGSPEVILIGGFCEIFDLCEACGSKVVGVIDPRPDAGAGRYPVLGTDDDAAALFPRYGHIPVVLTPDAPSARLRLAARYREIGYSFASLIHPAARVVSTATLGTGVVVQYGASVSSHARIGAFVRLNTGANVTHEVIVGDCSTVAPDAVLLGRVVVEEACYVGANATILPDLTIGAGALVGAGAVVTRDVAAGKVVAGNPARERVRRPQEPNGR